MAFPRVVHLSGTFTSSPPAQPRDNTPPAQPRGNTPPPRTNVCCRTPSDNQILANCQETGFWGKVLFGPLEMFHRMVAQPALDFMGYYTRPLVEKYGFENGDSSADRSDCSHCGPDDND